ncbi:MAG: hypothetical protein LBJ32_04955 [Oscillospiraceae bacterium]|nr:hypothetical protein [Oscillospiraceae bacterium]
MIIKEKIKNFNKDLEIKKYNINKEKIKKALFKAFSIFLVFQISVTCDLASSSALTAAPIESKNINPKILFKNLKKKVSNNKNSQNSLDFLKCLFSCAISAISGFSIGVKYESHRNKEKSIESENQDETAIKKEYIRLEELFILLTTKDVSVINKIFLQLNGDEKLKNKILNLILEKNLFSQSQNEILKQAQEKEEFKKQTQTFENQKQNFDRENQQLKEEIEELKKQNSEKSNQLLTSNKENFNAKEILKKLKEEISDIKKNFNDFCIKLCQCFDFKVPWVKIINPWVVGLRYEIEKFLKNKETKLQELTETKKQIEKENLNLKKQIKSSDEYNSNLQNQLQEEKVKLQGQIQDLNKQIQKEATELQELAETKKQFEEKNLSLKKQNKNSNEHNSNSQNQLQEENVKLQGQIQDLNEQIQKKATELQELTNANGKIKVENLFLHNANKNLFENSNFEKNKLQEENAKLQGQIQDLNKQIENLKSQEATEKLETQSSMANFKKQAETEINILKIKNDEIKSDLKICDCTIDNLILENSNLKNQLETTKENLLSQYLRPSGRINSELQKKITELSEQCERHTKDDERRSNEQNILLEYTTKFYEISKNFNSLTKDNLPNENKENRNEAYSQIKTMIKDLENCARMLKEIPMPRAFIQIPETLYRIIDDIDSNRLVFMNDVRLGSQEQSVNELSKKNKILNESLQKNNILLNLQEEKILNLSQQNKILEDEKNKNCRIFSEHTENFSKIYQKFFYTFNRNEIIKTFENSKNYLERIEKKIPEFEALIEKIFKTLHKFVYSW